jgi:hypothetical protein
MPRVRCMCVLCNQEYKSFLVPDEVFFGESPDIINGLCDNCKSGKEQTV